MSAEQKVFKQQVDASRSMVIGHTGDKIFDSITSNAVAEPDGSASETNLFAMLDSAIAARKRRSRIAKRIKKSPLRHWIKPTVD